MTTETTASLRFAEASPDADGQPPPGLPGSGLHLVFLTEAVVNAQEEAATVLIPTALLEAWQAETFTL